MSNINHSTNHKLTLGLFGFGVVGKGLYDVLESTPALKTFIKRICIKNPGKKRVIPREIFTTNAELILRDPDIDVIVELIDDANAAYHIVKKALQNGKAVVSANKKMIAAHLDELLYLQKEHNAAFLYVAACCASIPIIRNLEEYYDNDLLHSIRGIINGSTNYILTKIAEENLTLREALLQAQQLGFAETNPKLDIEGTDAVNKLTILAAHAFGVICKPDDLIFTGITAVTKQDNLFARKTNQRIKLVAHAQKLTNAGLAGFVLPRFVNPDDDLYRVNNEFNGLIAESCFADKQFFKGKGAGAFPTAAAVLSDIAALRYGYKYEYKKLQQATGIHVSNNYYLEVYVSANKKNKIYTDQFEWIEVLENENNYTAYTGMIHVQNLYHDQWWKEQGVSLITCNDPVVEHIDRRLTRKKRIELDPVL